MASSVFVSRLRGLPVLDSAGDQVGQVRDVVLQSVIPGRAPRAKGLVVTLFGRNKIFVPMARVHQVDPNQVVITGVIDTRKFSRRTQEILILDDLLDRQVTLLDGTTAPIYDVSITPVATASWEIDEVALRHPPKRPFGKGHVWVVNWRDIRNLMPGSQGQDTAQLLTQLEQMKPADIAQELHDLEPARRAEVATQLDDELLAHAIEELPEDEQVALISALAGERAADVLEEMNPDDAADLISDLAPAKAEELLGLMEPDEAEDVRALLVYGEFTAGGMMTPEPVILAPDDTVADALAQVRLEDRTPALASVAFVTRPPLEAPTGRYLGGVHFQRLLREPPSTLVSALIDENLQPISPETTLADVSRYFATYNLVVAPVVDADNHLLGAVSVDDVLDHMLPHDWRGIQMDEGEEVSDG